MTTHMYAQRMATKPIRVLIIQPDNTSEIKEISQELQTLSDIVGGYLERVQTPYGDLWFNEEGKNEGQPFNEMATYLWWKLCPAMEERDVIQGPCFVTGSDDGAGWSLPVQDEVVDLYERMEAALREDPNEGPAPSGAPTP